MLMINAYFIALFSSAFISVDGIFRRTRRWLDRLQVHQMNYGIAATDVDNDGKTDWFIAGYNGPNLVLKYDHKTRRLKDIALVNTPYEALMDYDGNAIGVCACDIDGDGREEIYVLNTNNAYGGQASYNDKLFKWRNNRWEDVLNDRMNANFTAATYSGRSVACIDVFGTGYYSFIITTYANKNKGNFALVGVNFSDPETDVQNGRVKLMDTAESAGIDKSTGGRSVLVGPIVNNVGHSDIFFGNEGNPWMGNEGDNFLFKNNGNGTFTDIARETGVTDQEKNSRGMSFADFNEDGKLDIVIGNWRGNSRIYQQEIFPNDTRYFRDIAPRIFKAPSNVRNILVADFDNDGNSEIFINNMCDKMGNPSPNKLFRVTNVKQHFSINSMDIGDASEPFGCGTGANYADVDGDGRLDMLISHGETKDQPITVYNAFTNSRRQWIRVAPKTQFGAPARGALVQLDFYGGTHMSQVIDCGSGYLCQMEPVAHFGLGTRRTPHTLFVHWPDGSYYVKALTMSDFNRVHEITYDQGRFGK